MKKTAAHDARENYISALKNVYENIYRSSKEILVLYLVNRRIIEMNGSEVIPPTIFKDMVQQLEEKSLLINEILETFLSFPEKDRNKTKTHAMKMGCGNHALSGLVAIMTNQKFPSDFQLFFVLLYIPYDSGK